MTSPAASWQALSGALRLCPGREPAIAGGRPVLAEGRLCALVHGQQGEQVGRTLAGVFTLCAHAHQRAADLALAAAAGRPAGPAIADPALLAIETARDHLRMIALEWPQRLAGGPAAPDLAWLRDCPLSLGAGRPGDARAAIGALRQWLEQRVLLEDPRTWLAGHQQPDQLAQWCTAHAVRIPPAACLAGWHPRAHGLVPETRCLELLDGEAQRQGGQLQQLAQALAADAAFVQQPRWQGRPAETGPWTRLRHGRDGTGSRAANAWTRLAARWLELVEIAAAGDEAAPLLASGALATGEGEALAWCEMARGLLLHWVRLDGAGGVRDYRVLAPTEWNFHPAGALARAVARLDPHETEAARALAAAFDPCVPCSIVAPH